MKLHALALLTAAVSLSTLCACGGGSAPKREENSDYISPEPLSAAQAAVGGDFEADEKLPVAAYKNIAFVLSGNTLARIDFSTGERVDLVSDTPAFAVGCDGSRFALVGSDFAALYDYDGKKLSEIALEPEASLSYYGCAAVDGDRVVFNSSGKKSDSIFLWDTKSRKVSELPSTWQAGARGARVKSLSFGADGVLYSTFITNAGIAGGDAASSVCDISEDRLISDFKLSASQDGGRIGSDGVYYYVEPYAASNGESWSYFISKVADDGRSSTVAMISPETLKGPGTDSNIIHDVHDDSDFLFHDSYSLEYSDGSNFVVYNLTAGLLVAFNISDSAENCLIALVPETSEQHWYSDAVKELAVQYASESGMQVLVNAIPKDEYDDRVRTKLLAGDDDFDVFFASGALLNSVLKNSAYYPLDEFEGLVNNFDTVLAEGVRGLMTADAGLFGIVLRAEYWGCLRETQESGIPDSWTIDDLFKFCDEIPAGKKVFGDRYMITRSVCNVIEDMIAKDGSIDEKKFSEILSKLKEYNDKGVLCDGSADNYLTYGMLAFDGFNILGNDVGEYRTVVNPTMSGTNYLTVEVLMVNRNSKNPESAAGFLELFTRPGYVYDNSGIKQVIGRDITKNSIWPNIEPQYQRVYEYSMKQYKDSKPSVLEALDGFSAEVADEVSLVFDGAETPDDAAKKLADRLSYIYLE